MTVTVTGSPTFQLYNGHVDPRFPIGSWSSDVLATGDLSGGFVIINLRFREPGLPPLPLAFSLEVLSGERVDVAAQDIQVTIINFSRAGHDGVTNNIVQILNVLQGADRSPSQPWPSSELFLGVPIRGLSAQFTFTWPTNTNGVLYFARAFGQMYLSEAMFELGGAQPVQSSIPSASGPSRPHGSLQEVRSQRVTKPESVGGMALAPGAPGFVGPVSVVAPMISPVISRPAVAARPSVSGRVTAGPSSFRPTGVGAQRARAVRTAAALANAEKVSRAKSRAENDAREALGDRAAARSAAAATKGKSASRGSRQVSVSQRASRGMRTTTFSI